eukprot:3110847-Prymnesium_polylepis.1
MSYRVAPLISSPWMEGLDKILRIGCRMAAVDSKQIHSAPARTIANKVTGHLVVHRRRVVDGVRRIVQER